MGISWTEEQQKVINLRNRNILVSAAAGSGKTAVLVERIISMLTDKNQPVDIDRLLISTFTNAAAAEMRERIGRVLEEKLKTDPENGHLRRQITLVHNAQITTIHGFCLYLIRNHFNMIDLDPGFRIGEEGELKLLKKDTLEELLEKYYEQGSESFYHFVECYAGGKSDASLEEHILTVYEFSRSHPWPEKWLSACLDNYSLTKTAQMEHSKWMKLALNQVDMLLEDYQNMIDTAIQIAAGENGPYMYLEALQKDQEIVSGLLQMTDYEGYYHALDKVKWTALGRKKDPEVSEHDREAVKMLRDQVKKGIENLKKQYFFLSLEDLLHDMQGSRAAVEVLVQLVCDFSKDYQKQKTAKNLIDFNDLEHYALKLLISEEEGEAVPTETAKEYSEYFHEILIDEYQDINMVQELILNSVSKKSMGKNNIFMVGDVKQSIYKFRLSKPELFMDKYQQYTLEDSPFQRIDLHKNFRSRESVLESINYIFYQIMRKELGNIEYNREAALYAGAHFPEFPKEDTGAEATEVLFLDLDKELLKEENISLTERELEAKLIAGRIRAMAGSCQVTDKITGEMRGVRYSDIVILLRSIEGWADTFAKVLTEEGIPCHTTSRTGYFSTIEIRTILNMLRIIDNPLQDIPLAAVMRSPIGRFSGTELANIRQEFTGGRFYESVRLYLVEGANSRLREKLKRFYEKLYQFRSTAAYTAIPDLINLVLKETGYGDYIAAMPGGEKRKANLHMLLEKARSYMTSSYKGLFNFVRYIEHLQKAKVDFGEAALDGEAEETVRIMSIHKSKGLEFPVVFVAGMGKGFNTQDARMPILMHQELGLGVDFIDPELRVKSPVILKRVIQRQTVLENLGEELRVLYVALTRAKEKLVIVGTVPKFYEKLNKAAVASQGGISYTQLAGAATYIDWMIPALIRHPELGTLLGENSNNREAAEQIGDLKARYKITVLTVADLLLETFKEKGQNEDRKQIFLNWEADRVFNEQVKKDLNEKMTYIYPYREAAEVRTKITVTELKKLGSLGGDEAAVNLYEEPEVIPLLPGFISGEEKDTGTRRGTAYHKVMELIAFDNSPDRQQLKVFIQKLAAEGKLETELAERVRPDVILSFFETELAARMAAADKRGELKREQPFIIGTKADEINPGYKSDELVLVQGIIDAYFEEEEKLVLVDYKSDYVESEAELIDKYKIQLNTYCRALEQLKCMPVKEKLIYSFCLKKAVRIN